ncbi:MAG: FHA domain-containing protein [Anaerolineae bacterium]|nr:FHA domain-containing protein [Anaerolineae bacterium]
MDSFREKVNLGIRLNITIMSGLEDGTMLKYNSENGDGHQLPDGTWVFSIGRHDDNDICLRNDTFVSREHARILFHNHRWQLLDNGSTNGTYIETSDNDQRVTETVPLSKGQIFRVGRTWLRLDPTD